MHGHGHLAAAGWPAPAPLPLPLPAPPPAMHAPMQPSQSYMSHSPSAAAASSVHSSVHSSKLSPASPSLAFLPLAAVPLPAGASGSGVAFALLPPPPPLASHLAAPSHPRRGVSPNGDPKRKRAQEDAAAAAAGSSSPALLASGLATRAVTRSGRMMPMSPRMVTRAGMEGAGAGLSSNHSSPLSQSRMSDGSSASCSCVSQQSRVHSCSSSYVPSARSSNVSTPNMSARSEPRSLAAAAAAASIPSPPVYPAARSGGGSMLDSPLARVLKRVCISSPAPSHGSGLLDRGAGVSGVMLLHSSAPLYDATPPASQTPDHIDASRAGDLSTSAPMVNRWTVGEPFNRPSAPAAAMPADVPSHPAERVIIKPTRNGQHRHTMQQLPWGVSDMLMPATTSLSAPASAFSSPPTQGVPHGAVYAAGMAAAPAVAMPPAALVIPSSSHRRPAIVSPVERALLRGTHSFPITAAASSSSSAHSSTSPLMAAASASGAAAHKRVHAIDTPPFGMETRSLTHRPVELHRHKRAKDRTPAMGARSMQLPHSEALVNSPAVSQQSDRGGTLSAAAAAAAATLTLQGYGRFSDSGSSPSSPPAPSSAAWGHTLDSLSRGVDGVHFDSQDSGGAGGGGESSATFSPSDDPIDMESGESEGNGNLLVLSPAANLRRWNAAASASNSTSDSPSSSSASSHSSLTAHASPHVLVSPRPRPRQGLRSSLRGMGVLNGSVRGVMPPHGSGMGMSPSQSPMLTSRVLANGRSGGGNGHPSGPGHAPSPRLGLHRLASTSTLSSASSPPFDASLARQLIHTPPLHQYRRTPSFGTRVSVPLAAVARDEGRRDEEAEWIARMRMGSDEPDHTSRLTDVEADEAEESDNGSSDRSDDDDDDHDDRAHRMCMSVAAVPLRVLLTPPAAAPVASLDMDLVARKRRDPKSALQATPEGLGIEGVSPFASSHASSAAASASASLTSATAFDEEPPMDPHEAALDRLDKELERACASAQQHRTPTASVSPLGLSPGTLFVHVPFPAPSSSSSSQLGATESPLAAELPPTGLFTGMLKSATLRILSPGSTPFGYGSGSGGGSGSHGDGGGNGGDSHRQQQPSHAALTMHAWPETAKGT